MSVNYTEADILEYRRRQNESKERKALEKWEPAAQKESKAVLKEKELHDAIIEHCKLHKWQYFHSRMDQRATITPGTPDLIIQMPEGRALFIECKAKGGKLSKEQQIVAMRAEQLGHKVWLVFNMQEFLNIVNQPQPYIG